MIVVVPPSKKVVSQHGKEDYYVKIYVKIYLMKAGFWLLHAVLVGIMRFCITNLVANVLVSIFQQRC